MATLYELADQYQHLTDGIGDPELPEEECRGLLAELQGKIEDKVESIGKLILSLQTSTEVIKAEVDRLSSRRRVLDTNIGWLKGYLLQQMTDSGIDKVERPVVTVSLRKAPPSCVVVNLEEIPAELLRIIPEQREADKKAIIDHFKETGEIIPGVEIIHDKRTVQIR